MTNEEGAPLWAVVRWELREHPSGMMSVAELEKATGAGQADIWAALGLLDAAGWARPLITCWEYVPDSDRTARQKVFGEILEAPESLSAAEIGRRFRMTREGLSRSLKELEKAGLIRHTGAGTVPRWYAVPGAEDASSWRSWSQPGLSGWPVMAAERGEDLKDAAADLGEIARRLRIVAKREELARWQARLNMADAAVRSVAWEIGRAAG